MIYDPDTPEDPFHNFWDKMDWFVIFHLTGLFFNETKEVKKCMTIAVVICQFLPNMVKKCPISQVLYHRMVGQGTSVQRLLDEHSTQHHIRGKAKKLKFFIT